MKKGKIVHNPNYISEIKIIRAKFTRQIKKLKAEEKEEIGMLLDAIKSRNGRIIKFHSGGNSYVSLARYFELSPSNIRRIVLRGK